MSEVRKKLNKLHNNSEKLMKDEELLALRGGSGSCCVCLNGANQVVGYKAASNQQQCHDASYSCGWKGSYGPWTYC